MNSFNAKTLSTTARKACKAQGFTPRFWEPLNAGHYSPQPEFDDTPIMRVWNSRREIVLTVSDLFYAE